MGASGFLPASHLMPYELTRQISKSILSQTFELTAESVFSRGSQAQGICYTTTAHQESVKAFLAKSAEKRPKCGI